MNIPNMEKELCSMEETKYCMEIEEHLASLMRNAIGKTFALVHAGLVNISTDRDL